MIGNTCPVSKKSPQPDEDTMETCVLPFCGRKGSFSKSTSKPEAMVLEAEDYCM